MTQMGLIDSYRTFHPNKKEYVFFPAIHGTFSKIGNILVHKANLNRNRKENGGNSSTSSAHYGLKFEFNNNVNSEILQTHGN